MFELLGFILQSLGQDFILLPSESLILWSREPRNLGFMGKHQALQISR